MVGRKKLLSFLEKGLLVFKGIQVEISAYSRLLRVIRFANSVIHQPLEQRDISLFVRVLHRGKLGFASVNGLSRKTFLEAVHFAKANAAVPEAHSPIPRFAKPLPVSALSGYVPATARTSAEALEKKVERLIRSGNSKGVSFAGVFWTLEAELSVVNSNGVRLYHPWTAANCQTVCKKGELSGFSAQASPDINKIDSKAIGEAALHRALRFKESQNFSPGVYPCLFSEYAVAELLLYLAGMAFTADAIEEGRSILGLKAGKKIAHESVSIWDDGLSPLTFRIPFDVEGVPRKKVFFIEKGVARNVVYDLATAGQLKAGSTGHALPLDYSEGPMPLHLEMAPGHSTMEEMLRRMKQGLFVTRLHYIREVHPLKTMVTGMTRDGLFRVENGQVAGRVKNLRFTESILRALSNVVAISKERKLVTSDLDEGFPVGILAPKILVEKFSFTGATRF